MIYNFKIATKFNKSNRHLKLNLQSANDIFGTYKLDTHNLSNSDFPQEIKSLTEEEWQQLKRKRKIVKTFITKTTISIEV